MRKIFLLFCVNILTSIVLRSQEIPTENQTNPIELDSMVYYKFTTEMDSVPYRKFEYQWDEYKNNSIFIFSNWDTQMQEWVIMEHRTKIKNANGDIVLHEDYLRYNNNGPLIGKTKYESIYNNDVNKIHFSYKWDSEQNNWINYSKTEYFYDELDRDTLHLSYNWDKENEEWIMQLKVQQQRTKNKYTENIYSYKANTDEFFLERTKDSVYSDSGKLIFYSHTEYRYKSKKEQEYNDDGTLKKESHYEWDYLQDDWKLQSIVEFNYNIKGKLDYSMQYQMSASDWNDTLKTEYIYNENDDIIFENSYNVLDGKWIHEGKVEYKYDMHDSLVYYETYFLNPTTEEWTGFEKEEYAYDNLGRETLNAVYDWSDFINNWYGVLKKETSYNKNGIEELVLSVWDSQKNDWTFQTQNIYTYNESGKIHYLTIEKWNNELNEWIPFEKRENIWDKYGYNFNLLRYSWDGATNTWIGDDYDIVYDKFGNYSVNLFSMNESLNDRQLFEKRYYYFTEKNISTYVQQNSNKKINVYPNPFVEQLSVQGDDFEGTMVHIYSLNGKLIQSCKVSNNIISLKDLQNGNYILVLSKGNKVLQIEKIMKL